MCQIGVKSTQISLFPAAQLRNMGRAAQIPSKSGIHVAAFGRGVCQTNWVVSPSSWRLDEFTF